MPSILKTALAALSVAPLTQAHTWIEQLRNVNDQGDYVGEYGYPRGMVSKTDNGFNGNSMNWEMPGANGEGRVFITETTPLCHPDQRKQQQSSDKYPRLQATPGGFIAMRYMENGHITLPNNQLGKPEKAGTVFVYGTTEPIEDEVLANVLQWTEDGKGGDGRGKLLTTNDFDDGRCYEKNGTPISQNRQKTDPNFAMGQVQDNQPGNYPLFCETNVKLPETADIGKPFTFYWVWQWNTAPGKDPGLPAGKDEYYSTCLDVDVASPNVALATEKDATKFDLGPQQDAMSFAVSDFASRTALMTDALQGEVGPVFSEPTGFPSGSPTRSPNATATATGRPRGPKTRTRSRKSRPTAVPTAAPSGGESGFVTVTDTVYVTVTAEPTPAPSAIITARHLYNKHGAKFRLS